MVSPRRTSKERNLDDWLEVIIRSLVVNKLKKLFLKYLYLPNLILHMQYKRILLKLSGEALMGERQYGIDPKRLEEYASDIKTVVDQGVEVAIVIGGGNIFRGKQQELAMEWTEYKEITWECWLHVLMV